MGLELNGNTNITDVMFNGQTFDKVEFNGQIVFEKKVGLQGVVGLFSNGAENMTPIFVNTNNTLSVSYIHDNSKTTSPYYSYGVILIPAKQGDSFTIKANLQGCDYGHYQIFNSDLSVELSKEYIYTSGESSLQYSVSDSRSAWVGVSILAKKNIVATGTKITLSIPEITKNGTKIYPIA